MALRAVKLPLAFLAVLRLLCILALLDGARATKFCQKVVEPLGYGCTEYSIQTDDGFVLVMHRLSGVDSLMGKGHTATTRLPVDSRNNGTGQGQPQSQGASDSAPSKKNPPTNSTSSRIPSCKDEGATSSASAHPAYPHGPAALGCRHTDPQSQSSDSLNGTTEEHVQPSILSGPSPGLDTSEGTTANTSSVQASIGADTAQSSMNNATESSTSPQTTLGSSPSNYTASPKVRTDLIVPIIHRTLTLDRSTLFSPEWLLDLHHERVQGKLGTIQLSLQWRSGRDARS